jgi:hypothetical protein
MIIAHRSPAVLMEAQLAKDAKNLRRLRKFMDKYNITPTLTSCFSAVVTNRVAVALTCSLYSRKGLGNNRCADCNVKGTRHASLTLGVFLCDLCSSVHIKYLEAPLSRVRNCETDTWTDKPLARIKEVGGNKVFNSVWEARMKELGRTKVDPAATVYQRSVFIKDK